MDIRVYRVIVYLLCSGWQALVNQVHTTGMLNSTTLPVQDEERAEKHVVRELIPLARETYNIAHSVFMEQVLMGP